MALISDEIQQAARRLLGEGFDTALDVEAICDRFSGAFLAGQLPGDACEADIELLLDISTRLYLEMEVPEYPGDSTPFGGRKMPAFLKPW
ncbi:hypothetical protein [Pseudomonas sp. EA_105y_Pfl2_R69]|uniref:hypothetical protein n=1 Tax=Pseudomonas sp. EA_105y_Pfl2_R69 TaxID=3088683 RepID=UPI0030D78879